MSRRGIALVSVLFSLVGGIVIMATLLFITYFDLQAASNTAAANDALYLAEGGLQHLWSILEPAPDFTEALTWPDGAPPIEASSFLPRPLQGYRVRVAGGPDGGLVALSEGTSDRGARARVEATFRRELDFRPAAVVLAGASLRSAAFGGALELAAADRDQQKPPLLSLGAESRSVATILEAAIGDAARPLVVGRSGFEAALAELRLAPDRTLTGPLSPETWGEPGTAEVIRLVSNAEVSGDVTATGIVLADAPLRVRGRFEVEGLLLAAHGVEIEGTLVVHGSSWVDENLTVSSAGKFQIDYSSMAVARADDLRPGILPRAAVLGAWREVW